MNLSGGWPIVLDPNELLIKAALPVLPSHIFATAPSPQSIPPDNIKGRLKDCYELNALSL